VFELFRDNLDYQNEPVYLDKKDIYGKNGKDYVTVRGWEL
jgi:hypothetical protein